MGYTSPNPPVACLAVRSDGTILAGAHTQPVGREHAERYLYEHSSIDEKHDLYVTLQPCTHFGRTPPCLDLILAKKPEHVFAGVPDPNPAIDHSRNNLYTENGIPYSYHPEVADIANHMLNGFMNRMKTGRPAFIIKTVLSKDGYFKKSSGESQRLSNKTSDNLTMMLRAKVDGIVVGPDTVWHDIPGLALREMNDLSEMKDRDLDEASGSHGTMIQCLNVYTKDTEMIRWHNHKIKSYQPWRIFVLGDEDRIPEEFIKKQHELNELLHSKMVLFFLLGNRNGKEYSKSILEQLNALTNHEIIHCKNELAVTILDYTGKLGLNQLVIEGGNLLYSHFAKAMGIRDAILVVKTQKNIDHGVKPLLNFSSLQLKHSFAVGSDMWEVY